MSLRTPSRNTFEIGLVMAGAASAGAYTAGSVPKVQQRMIGWVAMVCGVIATITDPLW
jgi:hypothetical protein